MQIFNKTKTALALGFITAMLALPGCSTAPKTASIPATVSAAAAQTDEISTFYKLSKEAGLSATLEGAGPLTVFAPSDEAFKAVPASTLDKLSKDPAYLKSVLTYHLVGSELLSGSITNNSSLATINGAQLTVSKAGDFVTVDDAMVIKADIKTGNGVIHIIDRVLLPAVKK